MSPVIESDYLQKGQIVGDIALERIAQIDLHLKTSPTTYLGAETTPSGWPQEYVVAQLLRERMKIAKHNPTIIDGHRYHVPPLLLTSPQEARREKQFTSLIAGGINPYTAFRICYPVPEQAD